MRPTDVAKASAAMVLTMPGLDGVVPAMEISRLVHQRIITYTLAMLARKLEMMTLLVVGFLVTGLTPLTPWGSASPRSWRWSAS